jgi:hypothetical protein
MRLFDRGLCRKLQMLGDATAHAVVCPPAIISRSYGRPCRLAFDPGEQAVAAGLPVARRPGEASDVNLDNHSYR